jgi:hypothetical protein
MKKRVTTWAAILFCLSVARVRDLQAQDITGYWQGTLRLGAGAGEYRELLRVWKTKEGELSATLEFTDTGGEVVPVTAISVSESNFMFRIDSVQASYEGTSNADASAISGVWKQPSFEGSLNFSRGTAARKEHQQRRPSDLDGYWTGTVKFDPIPGCERSLSEFRYVFHITNTVDGLTATWNMPDNGTLGWAATSVTRHDASLDIEMKQLAARFQGTLDKEKTVIDGTWMKNGNSYPLVLKRSQHLPEPVTYPNSGCSIDGMSGS